MRREKGHTLRRPPQSACSSAKTFSHVATVLNETKTAETLTERWIWISRSISASAAVNASLAFFVAARSAAMRVWLTIWLPSYQCSLARHVWISERASLSFLRCQGGARWGGRGVRSVGTVGGYAQWGGVRSVVKVGGTWGEARAKQGRGEGHTAKVTKRGARYQLEVASVFDEDHLRDRAILGDPCGRL